MDKPVPIIVELIVQIIGLPIRGMDPTLFLDDKTKETSLEKEMKKKYGTSRGKEASSSNESTMQPHNWAQKS